QAKVAAPGAVAVSLTESPGWTQTALAVTFATSWVRGGLGGRSLAVGRLACERPLVAGWVVPLSLVPMQPARMGLARRTVARRRELSLMAPQTERHFRAS